MKHYARLTSWLARQEPARVSVSFKKIEGVLGHALPPSAYKYRAWWSNNPDNNVMTRAWLNAGFESAEVDMAGQTLVFQRTRPMDFSLSGSGSSRGLGQAAGVADMSVMELGGMPLSDKALSWLNASPSRQDAIARAVEAAAAREARLAVLAKYAALSIGKGSDSVALIREDRDGR